MIMKTFQPAFLSCLLFASVSLPTFGAELTKFQINAEEWPEGDPPKEVFVVDGTIKIGAKDGNKAIMVDPSPITDASAQLAVSAAGESVIQAKVFATKRGRSSPRFGVSVHGMSGYRLWVNPNKKLIELVKGDETAASVPYTWKADSWVHVKLEARKVGEKDWSITGKVWDADATEPAEPLIKHTDKGLKGQGKAAVWATPYSDTPLYFDDIVIEVEAAPAAPAAK